MLIIDRFEGNIAVVENSENENMIRIEKGLIEETAREGDVIFFDGSGYKVDKEETERRRTEALSILKSIGIKQRRTNDNGK